MAGVFPGHKCQLTLGSRSNIPKLLPTASWYEKVWRALKKSVLVSNKNPLTARHFKSQAAVVREQRRQTSQCYFTIHPCSQFMAFWSIIVLFVFGFWIFAIPYHLIYYDQLIAGDPTLFSVPLQILVSIILYADIMVTFYLGYYDQADEEYILNRSAIRKRYLRILIPDICARFPVMVVVKYVGKIRNPNDQIFFLKYTHTALSVAFVFYFFNLLSISKIVRYYRVVSVYLNSTARIDLTLQVFVGSYLILHITTLMSTLIYMHIGRMNWHDEHIFYKVILITFQGFLGTVHQDFTNKDITAKYVDCFIIFFGWIGSALFIILLKQTIMSYDSSSVKYDQFAREVKDYSRKFKLPNQLHENLVYYIEHKFRNNYFNENHILHTLSTRVTTQITMDQCKQLVNQVELFKNMPSSVIKSIVKCLKLEIFLPGETIIHHNEVGNKMFFLNSGSAAVVSQTGIELKILEDGAYFGEISLLVENKKRNASIIAKELCETYILSKVDFYNVVEPNSELLEQMRKIAYERIRETKRKTDPLSNDL